MADTKQPTELDIQTQHVYEVALGNLNIVIDQLESVKTTKADSILEALDTAKQELTTLVG